MDFINLILCSKEVSLTGEMFKIQERISNAMHLEQIECLKRNEQGDFLFQVVELLNILQGCYVIGLMINQGTFQFNGTLDDLTDTVFEFFFEGVNIDSFNNPETPSKKNSN